MSSISNRTDHSGFTVVEFLLGLAASSIILVGFATGVSHRNDQLLIDEAARNLQLTLAFARNQAISRRSSIRVCPASATQTCAENSDWNKGWVVYDFETNEVIRVIEPTSLQVNLHADQSVNRYVQFNVLGDAFGTAGEFTVCHTTSQDYHVAIRVSAIGHVERLELKGEWCNNS